jgi:hypothetical protein
VVDGEFAIRRWLAADGVCAVDVTTSHSTRLPKDDSQVAGYVGERCGFRDAPSEIF